MSTQFCFDFAAPPAAPRRTPVAPRSTDAIAADARAYWRVGMVTSLPMICTVQDSEQRYTQMLPGVVESIACDLADVRIYATPEYGYWLENYPLHQKLAINVPLRELGRYHGNDDLRRLADEGRLATGDENLAAELRARTARLMSAREHKIAGV